MTDRLERYRNDAAFKALTDTIGKLLEHVGEEFTTGEIRDGFTTALERREFLRVRPSIMPGSLPTPGERDR